MLENALGFRMYIKFPTWGGLVLRAWRKQITEFTGNKPFVLYDMQQHFGPLSSANHSTYCLRTANDSVKYT